MPCTHTGLDSSLDLVQHDDRVDLSTRLRAGSKRIVGEKIQDKKGIRLSGFLATTLLLGRMADGVMRVCPF